MNVRLPKPPAWFKLPVRPPWLRFAILPRWLRFAIAGTLIVLVSMMATWTTRHAWAIYKLNRGVGDTVFYDAEGNPWFRLDEQRRDVRFEQISTYVKDAVIAVEDHRYYRHPGIDPIGLTRATLYNVRSGSGVQGGSTITQQLARTLYLSNVRSYGRKVQEAVLAVMLEVFLSKREILQLYLNRVYLSGGIYGVESMSQKMLGKSASQLTLGEAALIAGIIRAPASYSPWTHFDAARRRSFVVLRRMREEKKITAAQEQSARAETIRIRPQPSVSSARYGYAKEYLRQQFRDVYGGDNPPDWRVQTTFVPAIQDAAEIAVRDGLRRIGRRDLQAALVAIDPHTGNLLAMVGGSDFAVTSFNRAYRSRRQPGSAFKPFVYAVALESGLSPVSKVNGLRQVAVQAPEGVWIPRDERAGGQDALTLREALLESNNAAAVKLQQEVGTRPVLRLASDLGVDNQPDVPSLALGSGLVTPLDLTAAYAVFPNLGYRVRPRGLVSVVNANGETVHQVHIEREKILPDPVAFQMVSMLQDVVDRGTGAAVRAQGIRGPVGGKTGTTSEYRDAWFVGFNSSVVVGVWVGYDQPQTIGDNASGARTALPIWADFMRRTVRRLPAQSFSPPDEMRTEQMCMISYHRALDGCPTYVEYFKEGDSVPTQLCELHSGTLQQRAERAVQGLIGALGRSIRRIFK
ncbi:MAG TPA: PBP1A family penicillin-binding protein [Vicinamibacterales bacterium]|nr:PBP1A family penicillin-binding protein [Vicinamibacterales bacterium]